MDDGFLGTLLAVVIGKAVYDGSKSKLPTDRQKEVNQHFTKWAALPFGVLVLISMMMHAAFGQTHTFRDANGRVTGYATTNNAGTVYRNSLGQNTGRSSTQNGTTTFYNSRGQQAGTARSNNR
jgi:hypothetical protein